jgi:hypothetical protein
MAIKKEIDINVNTKGAEDSVNNLSSGLSGVAAQADRLTGGLVSGFRNGVKGIRTAITGMKSLKVAIASTGIGLLVVAIGSLVAFFTKTQRGADMLSKASKGLGAVVDVLVDRLSSLGEILVSVFSNPQKAIKDFGKLVKDNIQNRIMGLVELLPALGKAISLALKGKFKEAGQTAVDAAAKVTLGVENLSDKVAGAAESVKGLAKEISDEAKAALELEAAQQALEDREIALIKVNAERRASIEELRLVAEDENKTNEERADALRAAAKLQNDIADDEIAIAKERARIIRERVALGESTREDLEEQANAEAEVIRLEGERSRRLRTLQTRLNAFTKGVEENTDVTDENAEAQAKLNEEIKKRDEALAAEEAKLQETLSSQYDKILEAQNDAQTNELNAVEDKYNTLIAKAEEFGFDEAELNRLKNEEIAAVNKKFADQNTETARQQALDEQAILDAKLAAQLGFAQSIGGVVRALGGFAKEGTAAAKAAALADIVINTGLGFVQGLDIAQKGAKATGPAAPFAFPIFYATQVAAVLNAVGQARNILAKVPTDGGGSGGGGLGGVPRPNITAPSSTPRFALDTQASDLGNQITQSLQGQPVRAYVVNQDIQNANKLDRKIKETATLE